MSRAVDHIASSRGGNIAVEMVIQRLIFRLLMTVSQEERSRQHLYSDQDCRRSAESYNVREDAGHRGGI